VSSVEIKRRMAPDDIAVVSTLLDAASHADGQRALSDHEWLDLEHGGGEGFAGLLARDGTDARPVAYAQVSRSNQSWGVQLVVEPDQRARYTDLGRELLSTALDVVARSGGGSVHWWVARAGDVHARLAAAVGLRPGRVLHQMRRALPTGLPNELTTRPFVVGRDETAWLEVNNAAFDGHPEQGGWTLETIAARETEPWFDPAGFLLHERDGRLAGFCWTKIHADHHPVLGEIYVIAVHPDFHGLGLGRSLALAGLDHLARQGVRVGMLYVDGDNVSALHLYKGLGFTVDHSDRAFVGIIAPE
jgi:mycothiol synthase